MALFIFHWRQRRNARRRHRREERGEVRRWRAARRQLSQSCRRAAARRVPQSDVTHRVTRKLPRAARERRIRFRSAPTATICAGLRAQLVAKGLIGRRRARHGGVGQGAGRGAGRHGRHQRTQVSAAHAGHGARRRRHCRRATARCAPICARRESGATGRGIRVGVLSDSYDCAPGAFEPGAPFTRAAQDIANGDLPRDVLVLKDLAAAPSDDCSDEGRAMMQLIHDVAPGSPLAFYTAFESQEDFRRGHPRAGRPRVRRSSSTTSSTSPSRCSRTASSRRRSTTFIATASRISHRPATTRARPMNRASGCRPSAASPVRATTSRTGRGVDGLQSATASAGSVTLLSVQWDQPSLSANGSRGAQSDVDVWFYDANGEPFEICTDDPAQLVCQIPGFDANIGGDAVETPIMVNFSDEDIEVQIGIELFEGPRLTTSSTCGSISTPACSRSTNTTPPAARSTATPTPRAPRRSARPRWYQTEEWGSPLRPQCLPACLNSFSSAGGSPVFFGTNGRRLQRARGAPQARASPDRTAVTLRSSSSTSSFEVPGTTEPDGIPELLRHFGLGAARGGGGGAHARPARARHRLPVSASSGPGS